MSGKECTKLDFVELQHADVVVALLTSPSYGVCVELGWASALQLPIVLLNESGSRTACTPLIEGLGAVTHCYLANSTAEVLDLLSGMPQHPSLQTVSVEQ